MTAVSALMVALDMIFTHKHTKSWALEVMLITDGGFRSTRLALTAGESAFRQDEYEEALQRFDDYGVKLSVM
jgi:ATP-dependent DNA helicase 2 subunit 2